MNRINALMTEANGSLAKKSKEMIFDAIGEAEEFVFSLFKIDWDIGIVVSNRLYNILIPEDRVGGRTHASYFIEFGIDEENEMILSKLREQLDLNDHDYQKVFFTGDDELPRWSGYLFGEKIS